MINIYVIGSLSSCVAEDRQSDSVPWLRLRRYEARSCRRAPPRRRRRHVVRRAKRYCVLPALLRKNSRTSLEAEDKISRSVFIDARRHCSYGSRRDLWWITTGCSKAAAQFFRKSPKLTGFSRNLIYCPLVPNTTAGRAKRSTGSVPSDGLRYPANAFATFCPALP